MIVKAVNIAFICLIVLCMLYSFIDMVSADSSHSHGNSGKNSDNQDDKQSKGQPAVSALPNPSNTVTKKPRTDPTMGPNGTPNPSSSSGTAATQPVYTIDMRSIYATPTPTLTDTNYDTTWVASAPIGDNSIHTILKHTTAYPNSTMYGNGSRTIQDAASGQREGPLDNSAVLAVVTIPAILAALVIVVLYVRKTE